MTSQTIVDVEQSQAAVAELQERVARLEETVVALRTTLDRLLAPPNRPSFRNDGYAWVQTPSSLKNVSDLSQLEPEDLVYIHELTDKDVRLRLAELEQWYGLSSEMFYQRWQQGEADDILDKIEWSILYEDWLSLKTDSSASSEEAA